MSSLERTWCSLFKGDLRVEPIFRVYFIERLHCSPPIIYSNTLLPTLLLGGWEHLIESTNDLNQSIENN